MCICLYQQVVWSAPTSLHQGTERSQAKFWFIWGESTNACFKHCCSTKVESNDLLLWGEQNRSLNVLYRSRHLWRYAMRLKAAHQACRRLGDDRTYRWDKNEENLVWISIKLALIFSLITVSLHVLSLKHTELDGFHYLACWFIYLDGNRILQIFFCWNRTVRYLKSVRVPALPAK